MLAIAQGKWKQYCKHVLLREPNKSTQLPYFVALIKLIKSFWQCQQIYCYFKFKDLKYNFIMLKKQIKHSWREPCRTNLNTTF